MAWSDEQLTRAFMRTDGCCHICCGKMVWGAYGQRGARGAWEMEHSVARVNGGTNHGNNLYAAHISCNRGKGARSTRAARVQYGLTRAPYSRAKKQQIRTRNTLGGAAGGALVGGAIGGPPGALVGGFIGAVLGNKAKPGR